MNRRLAKFAAAGAASLATAITGIIPLAAPPLAAGNSQSFTFEGQCQLSGTAAFSKPVTTSPARVRNRVTAKGTCSGSLTDPSGHATQLSDSPVQYRATEFGTQESCELNQNARGNGALIFQVGTLRFRIVENRVNATALLSFTGRRGGSATAIANVNSPDPTSLLEQCAGGGISAVPVDLVIQTTPAISG
jgi:hypothetical protein